MTATPLLVGAYKENEFDAFQDIRKNVQWFARITALLLVAPMLLSLGLWFPFVYQVSSPDALNVVRVVVLQVVPVGLFAVSYCLLRMYEKSWLLVLLEAVSSYAIGLFLLQKFTVSHGLLVGASMGLVIPALIKALLVTYGVRKFSVLATSQ